MINDTRKWKGAPKAAGMLGMIGLLGAGALATAEDVGLAPLGSTVAVEDVRSTESEVVGKIVNETGDQLEHLRLLIADQFLWKNERHPGADSPSNAYSITLDGPIPPHGTTIFRFQRPAPLPQRSDGTFTTEVSPVEAVRRPVITASQR